MYYLDTHGYDYAEAIAARRHDAAFDVESAELVASIGERDALEAAAATAAEARDAVPPPLTPDLPPAPALRCLQCLQPPGMQCSQLA